MHHKKSYRYRRWHSYASFCSRSSDSFRACTPLGAIAVTDPWIGNSRLFLARMVSFAAIQRLCNWV